MPHIDIKCYPKHLSPTEMSALSAALVEVAVRHLKASSADVSILYTEIPAEEWKVTVWDSEILPEMDRLLKRPGYKM
jgi:4-oxalocrotonate tautomerase